MSMQYNHSADLWSLGTIVFQCLTGRAPFQAQTPQALKQFYEKNANLAPRWVGWVGRGREGGKWRIRDRTGQDRTTRKKEQEKC